MSFYYPVAYTQAQSCTLTAGTGLIVFDQYHENLYGPKGKQLVWVQWQGPEKMEVIYPFNWKTAEYITPPWIK